MPSAARATRRTSSRASRRAAEQGGLASVVTAAVMVWRTVSIRLPVAAAGSPRCPATCASARLTAAARAAGTHSRDQVQRLAVDRCGPTGWTAPRRRREPSAAATAPGPGRRPNSTTRRATACRPPATADRRAGRCPARAAGGTSAAGGEPAGAAAALDQPLVAQLLERPPDGHPADAVPAAQHRLALQRARSVPTSPSAIRSRSAWATRRTGYLSYRRPYRSKTGRSSSGRACRVVAAAAQVALELAGDRVAAGLRQRR